MDMFGSSLQIVTAVILVILLFAFGFFIYNMELVNSYMEAGKTKKEVSIFKGISDLRTSDSTYDTMTKESPAFKDIAPSYNQPGGAEFTYNFWLYKDSSAFDEVALTNDMQFTDTGVKPDDLILFLHGDKNVYEYKNICGIKKMDVKVKCPLVKLERGGDVLTVEFNTLSSPDAVKEQSRNTCTDYSTAWEYMNAHKIAIKGLRNPDMNKKWIMVTIVIQDTSPNDPLPIRNKVRCRIFVNGTMELDRYVDSGLGLASGQSLLRRNNSFFYVNPTLQFTPYIYSTPGKDPETKGERTTSKVPASENSLMMADLSYFNYALNSDEVKSMFSRGFTQAIAAQVTINPLTNSIKDAPKVVPSGKKEYSSLA